MSRFPGRPRRVALIFALALLLTQAPLPARAGPAQPAVATLLGTPASLSVYWHDQRGRPGDEYACALFAQAAVLEALGYDFEMELSAARELGVRDHWYAPTMGALGLGQPLRAKGVPYAVFGTPLAENLTPQRALVRLQYEVAAGHYAIVNVDATKLGYYQGTPVQWHTLWITGIRQDARGLPVSVIANDSYRGPAVEYSVSEFLNAWASEFNFYAIFVRPADQAGAR